MSRCLRPLTALLVFVGLILPARAALKPGSAAARPPVGTYANPLPLEIPGGGLAESCADPSLIKGQQAGDQRWYLYCTTDPLNSQDRDGAGDLIFHRIPMFSSTDLVRWTYETDAFTATNAPAWAAPTAGLWAPEIHYANNQYYLYYVVTDVSDATSGEPNCGGDSAIGVATAPGPLGPWTDHGSPVIAPRRGGSGCNFLWTFDPEVIATAAGPRYIYYGSYYGGIFAQELSADGFSASNPVQVTIANRYEGAEVAFRDGFYYLFASAANCCNGPLTGYSVFVGRSASPAGPFSDREGVSLLAGQVGGTPFLNLNGNRWVGPGHNSVFTDLAGQWWTVYHAIDQGDPYFAGEVGFTKRPALLDPIDWIDGWPSVRGGRWASDEPQPAPAAQPGDIPLYAPRPLIEPRIGPALPAYSDEFAAQIGAQWSWVRAPLTSTYAISGGALRLETAAADLFEGNNSAPVLLANAPAQDYVVETRLTLDLPPEGCCFNYVQAGLVIYGDDDNFIKLVHVSIWETRQTEFAKERFPVPAGFPRYGNTVGGPPGATTWLRIAARRSGAEVAYTAYTSRDGERWVRGGTWRHQLGASPKIGLVAMGGSGFAASFDYVRVHRLLAHAGWMPLIAR
ncbi:MAG TPA: family 43 glycosylhydrolase [Herpetosiphonaceae bacterium]|nr:family 43 glycosylhydrolase [Herpetosiphonaceae bacterium]